MGQQNIVKEPIRRPNNRPPIKKKWRLKKKFKRNMLLLLIIFLLFAVVKAIVSDAKENQKSGIANNNYSQQTANLQSLKCLDDIKGSSAKINKYFIYGTHLNAEGSLDIPNKYRVKNASIVLRKDDGKEQEYAINYKINGNKLDFKASDKINQGIYLDEIGKGDYYLLLKLLYDDNSSQYFSLENNTKYKNTQYYTVTKNRSNRKIDIFSGNYKEKNTPYFMLSVKKSKLPDDVYDIVIDAGHGGKDTGASYGQYCEADITIKYAKELKVALEKRGLKVKMTRQGDEDKNSTAYSAFSADGRVNKSCGSRAKYCFSIHLNSAEQKLEKGGLQIYCNANMDTSFAENMAKEIVKSTGMEYSPMVASKVADGVYCRNFSKSEIASSNATTKFEPYNITQDTNYYFIIRELGGIATNAYMDGRNPKYGKNDYCDSNVGIESYLLEMGYIIVDKDLDIILNEQKSYVKALAKQIEKEVGIR